MSKRMSGALCAGAALLFFALPARATDGHFLHGVGAVNSAMGGAGVAAPVSILGTFYLNPAGLMAFDGTRIEFSFELFKPQRTVSSTFTTQQGVLSGSTESKSEFVPIPALAFTLKLSDNVVVGLAGLGIGGFGVDYPQDNANPLLGPRPFGFGQLFSNYTLLKFTPAIAFAPTEDLWLGLSANVAWATLTVDPFPGAPPAVTPGQDGQLGTLDDEAFYSRATATDGSFGVGFQAGLLWNVDEMFAIGAAYSSPLWFEQFKWNAMWENPGLSNFGQDRTMVFNLDVPAFATAGVAVMPTEALTLAGDVRYFFYSDTRGFEIPNADNPFLPADGQPDGSVQGFGWENIWGISAGIDFAASDYVSLRAGYNFSENPIPDEFSFFNAPAPAIVQHHVTAGFSVHVSESFAIDLGYYHAFANDGTGPFYSPFGPFEGTSVTNELSEDAILLGFTFTPGD